MKRCPRRPVQGFTMVELVVVVVITALLSVALAAVMRPAILSHQSVRARAELVDQGDTALRRLVQDVRMSVPNSIRSVNTQCFELIPASVGGRYRKAADTERDAPDCAPSSTCSAPLDQSKEISAFDSLSTLSPVPSAGDWVVINNQNSNDVYETGVNRVAISGAVTTPQAWAGRHRIPITPKKFSQGYDGGRFLVIPDAQKAVFYVCSGADDSVDGNGDGKGTLYRLKNYGFNATYPSTCPSVTGADVLANKLVSCSFLYNPNQGATQQSGFLAMQLVFARNGEQVRLAVGAHVSNVP